ncbi:Uncharacterized protein Adt_48239 [Abeliophyllum distichum]|uniref:Uncharacterized protein n=1 Tax=Abeliophyllum distichum TaxID=126358 RepID=A0ABD1NRK8_9LAMI
MVLNASHTTEVVDYKMSTKHCLDALDWQTTKLCDVVETLEKKVKKVEVDILELNIQLDKSRMIVIVAILPDLYEEMKAMIDVVAILPGHAVGNGQAPAQEYAPRLKTPELCAHHEGS